MSTMKKMEMKEYFNQLETKHPNGNEYWQEFRELHSKKLWHQLTLKLLKLVHLPISNEIDLLALYENFIIDFETRINPLSLIELVSFIIKQINDYQKCIAYIDQMKVKVKNYHDASILCSILSGQIRLANSDLKGLKDILDEISPLIEDETGVTPVHGRYFQLSSDYYQLIGNHCQYYRNALRYLGCTEISNEPVDALKKRAFALALAALLGEDIFNFGELLQHPIIKYLKETNPWLVDLLYAFNSGDLNKYDALRPQWLTQPDLAAHEIQLRQKISLLCLMEMTFKSSNGVLSFTEIAQATHLQENEVELLVIKALSFGLVKGHIDEVDRKVMLTWVQPRVLDKQQIASLRGKLDNWCRDVRKMETLLEQKGHDILG